MEKVTKQLKTDHFINIITASPSNDRFSSVIISNRFYSLPNDKIKKLNPQNPVGIITTSESQLFCYAVH